MQALFASADTHVNYGGALELPFCIGSIVVPLEIENKEPILLTQWQMNPSRNQKLKEEERSKPARMGAEADNESHSVGRKKKNRHEANELDTKDEKTKKETDRNGSDRDGRDNRKQAAEASRRHTHRRICYIRDGSELSLDNFYRWFYYYYTANRLSDKEEEDVGTSQSKRKRAADSSPDDSGGTQNATDANDVKEAEEEQQLFAQFLQLFNHHRAQDGSAPPSAADASHNLSNPSPLYALIESVEFSVPSSFPAPHRVLRHPPFYIEDLTWAEHPVEVKINFLSLLRVKPFFFTHHVKWHPRVAGTVQLLQSQFCGAMRQEVVDEVEEERRLYSGDDEEDGNNKQGKQREVRTPAALRGRMERLCRQMVVNEKRDAIKFFYPTELLSRVVAHVYEHNTYHAEMELLEQLYQQGVFHHYESEETMAEERIPSHYLIGGTLDDSLAAIEHFAATTTSSPPPSLPAAGEISYPRPSLWDLPYEFALHWHNHQQQQLVVPAPPPPPSAASPALNRVPFELTAHTRSEAALLSVLQTLEAEQVELLGACEEQLGAIAARVVEVQATMKELFAECEAEAGRNL